MSLCNQPRGSGIKGRKVPVDDRCLNLDLVHVYAQRKKLYCRAANDEQPVDSVSVCTGAIKYKTSVKLVNLRETNN